MKKSLIILIVLAVFSVLSATEKDRLAVMDVQDKDNIFGAKTKAKITDYIFGKLQGTGIYWMIPKSDRDTALEQAIEETKQGSRKECVDEKCQLSLVAELQANFLINTEIIQLVKGKCQVSIKKFDVEKRAGTDAWAAKFDCTEGAVYEAIDNLSFGEKKSVIKFQTGKIGEIEDDWTPDMAGNGEYVIIQFTSDPAGATVSIDGVVVGQTPNFKSKMLPSGKHQIKMEKEGFYKEAKVIDLVKGSKIHFNLQQGILFNSNPSGAIVRINGEFICETPCRKVINEEETEVTFQKELFETASKIIKLQRG